MGKKKKATAPAKAPVDAATDEDIAARVRTLGRALKAKPGKKERKAIVAELDELRTEIDRRDALERERVEKAAKAAKKARKEKAAAEEAELSAHRKYLARLDELDSIANDPTAKKKDRKAATAELERLRAEGAARTAKADAEAKKRVAARRAERAAAAGDEMRHDEKVAAKRAARNEAAGRELTEAEHQYAHRAELEAETAARVKAKKAEKVEKATAEWSEARDAGDDAKLTTPEHEATIVETETGREFAVGSPSTEAERVIGEDGFADPVTGDRFDPELGLPLSNHKPPRPLVWDAEAEKLVPYTRVTTFIDCLDDKALLDGWKQRTILAGAAIQEAERTEDEDPIVTRARDLALGWERTIAKVDKADRKGRLRPGERGVVLGDAEKEYKRGMAELAEEALAIGGAHTKAEHGTHLHKLTAIYDEGGLDALKAADPSPADYADVLAYIEAMEAAGITPKDILHVEQRIVDDENGVTGTFDRGLRYRPIVRNLETGEPELDEDGNVRRAARSVKVIGDLKTGRVDYGAGKIAMQIAEYAGGKFYDPLTHERTNTGYSKRVGLLIHLPAGTATCSIWEVDLTKGFEGLKLAVAVRGWRKSTTEAQSYRGKTPFYREVASISPDSKEK